MLPITGQWRASIPLGKIYLPWLFVLLITCLHVNFHAHSRYASLGSQIHTIFFVRHLEFAMEKVVM